MSKREIKIHYFVWHNKHKLYLCNQAFLAKKLKSTRVVANITCFNCLRKIQKGGFK